MRHVVFILCLIGSIVFLSGGSIHAADQLPPLPADLLFTTGPLKGDFPRNIIVRVDAETLDVSPFYVDDEALEIVPLSWSPQGDLLAIHRVMQPIDDSYTLFPRQLCILNREGELQQCLENAPPMHYGGTPQSLQFYYPVAWGNGGQTITYQTEFPNEESIHGYGRRLIEANLITGETHVLYEYPDALPIDPSPSLSHAAVGFGTLWGGSAPAYLVNLATGVQVDITNAVPALTKLYSLCLPFSPNGNYITVQAHYNLATYTPDQDPRLDNQAITLLVILDTQGAVQHIIGEPDGLDTLWAQDCPGWQPDEQAIYFKAINLEYKSFIMRYSLLNEQLEVLYQLKDWPELEAIVYPPLIVSPDSEHVALTVADSLDSKRQVAVLYPDGEIRRIPSSYHFSLYPLWVPPLNE